jgi:hypothetical protein
MDLDEAVLYWLWLLARRRKTTVSAVANDLLDKALPRWRMEREA